MIQMSDYLNPFLGRLSLLVKKACFQAKHKQNAQPFIRAAQPYLTVLEKALAQFTWSEETIEYNEHFPSNESLRPLAFLIQILGEITSKQEAINNREISKEKLIFKYLCALDHFNSFQPVETNANPKVENFLEELMARYLRVLLRFNFLQLNETLELAREKLSTVREKPLHLMEDLEFLKFNIKEIYQIGVKTGLSQTPAFIDAPKDYKIIERAIKNACYPALDGLCENFENGFYFSNNQYTLFPTAKTSSSSTISNSDNPVHPTFTTMLQ